jgi:hypothetical protein
MTTIVANHHPDLLAHLDGVHHTVLAFAIDADEPADIISVLVVVGGLAGWCDDYDHLCWAQGDCP